MEKKEKSIHKLYDELGGNVFKEIGMYDSPDQDIETAHQNTILRLIRLLPPLKKKHRILILGSGFGNTARYIAEKFSSKIDIINPDKFQNQKNEQLTEEAGLADIITIHKGNFQHLPFEGETFEIVLSQDSFSHKAKKNKIFRELKRVLKTSGRFIFTSYLSQKNITEEELSDLSKKTQLKDLGSTKMYNRLVRRVRLESVYNREFPDSLKNHSLNILKKLNELDNAVIKKIGKEVITNEQEKWEQRLKAQEEGLLNWGIFQFQKMND